ncbi:MAG TPA: hypothetical protein VFK70_17190 [Vicinamibacteria bacterium]|nr:hypothetical protein [Vicinamibacteria bacterium]
MPQLQSEDASRTEAEPLTEEQLRDIESLARESSTSNGRLKYLAPDAVLRLASEVRALRAALETARATFIGATGDLDDGDAARRRAAIVRIQEAFEGENVAPADRSWIDRAVGALIDLGWLPAEGRDWAAGILRRHVDGDR